MSAQRDNLLKRCSCDSARWPKCPHPWHLVGRFSGTRYSISLDKYAKRRGLGCPRTRGEADTLADRIVKEIETGTYEETPTPVKALAPAPTATPAVEGLTFDQAWPKFVDAIVEPSEVGRATVKQFRSRYQRFARTDVPDVGPMGAQPVSTLTKPVVEALYRAATKGMANSTKHKYRQVLIDLVEWSVEAGHLAHNPVTKTTKLPAGPDAMRKRRVHPDEEANLLQAATETQAEAGTRLVALLVLAFDLGGRLGELLAVRWRDILWDEGPRGRVRFAALEEGARKGGVGEARRVPMTARVRMLLGQLRVSPTGKDWASTAYVLGDGIGERVTNVRKAWVTCVLRAHNHEPQWVKGGQNTLAPESRALFKRLDLHFHDIRHERALRWLEEGRTLGTIAQMLGHHDLSTLRVYLGLAERDALREAEAVDAEMPVEGPPVQVRRHDGQTVIVAAGRPRGSKPAANRGAAALRVVRRKEAQAS